MKENFDIYQNITNQILEAMENCGKNDWKKSWVSNVANLRNAVTGRPYTGINVLLLGFAIAKYGYKSTEFATAKQCFSKGWKLQKGCKIHYVYFFSIAPIDKNDESKGTKPILTSYKVINADYMEGYEPSNIQPYNDNLPILEAEKVINSTQAKIVQVEGNAAYYSPSIDQITMPKIEQFDTSESYYSVLLHELTHWTGHKDRLAREYGKRFGDSAYAFEELIAELGSAFLCAKIGISESPRLDHAQYLANWISVLKNDKRAIVTAASQAQKASDYILGSVA